MSSMIMPRMHSTFRAPCGCQRWPERSARWFTSDRHEPSTSPDPITRPSRRNAPAVIAPAAATANSQFFAFIVVLRAFAC